MDQAEKVRDFHRWLVAERTRLGWSASEMARRARGFALEEGLDMKLTQQSISDFENRGAEKKRMPIWAVYVRKAVDMAAEETSEDPHSLMGLDDSSVKIQRLPTFAGAGGGGSGDGDIDRVSFSRDLIERELRARPADLLAVEVEGNSMEPDFQSGDQLLVDSRKRSIAQPGAFCLWDGDGYVIKYLEKIYESDPPKVRVISRNAMYSAAERLADEIDIRGRVIWFGRRV